MGSFYLAIIWRVKTEKGAESRSSQINCTSNRCEKMSFNAVSYIDRRSKSQRSVRLTFARDVTDPVEVFGVKPNRRFMNIVLVEKI